MSKIAAIQMTSKMDVDDNLRDANNLLRHASREAKVAVLPENFAFMGFDEEEKLKIAEDFGHGHIQDTISSMAKRFKLWIVAGTIPIKQPDSNKLWATTIVYDELGEVVARYNKIHLFDVSISPKESYEESKVVAKGYEPVCVDTPVGRMGLSICYDLRFPELYRKLTDMGAELFVVPSAFTYITGRVHWEVLLRARAIENLSYVVAANQGGDHQNSRRTYGHSMIVSPWGEVLKSMTDPKPGVIVSEVKLKELHAKRDEFPSLAHRSM